MKNMTAIILAAGRGTRMKSRTPKVLHEILGRPILSYVIDSLRHSGISDIITVAGYGRQAIEGALEGEGIKVILQKKLLGSGDAVNSVRKAVKKGVTDVLVACGDAPLVRAATFKKLIAKHRESGASATVLTARMKDPANYGRILRDNGKIVRIVEKKDAALREEAINEINVGAYCFKAKDLFSALLQVKPDNSKKEYYLTDVIEILKRGSLVIESVSAEDESEAIGVNTRNDLAAASRVVKDSILFDFMLEGVTIEDPATTVIYPGVKIASDTTICPNTVIESDVVIGQDCLVGPFARLRPGTRIADGAEVGNFVELVRTAIGKNTKVKHHTYLGDTIVGKNVNIGAGTITANFDGKNKNKTVIGDGAFIGVGAVLIAPVKIGKKATVGAGCVVPKGKNVHPRETVVGVPARTLSKERKK
jgi:bifunctional UDP-N-acetylglucosamine pyrophosphorylase/glucosamine-1-phosphate N-acetyltransferase